MTAGGLPATGGIKPTLIVTIDYDRLLGRLPGGGHYEGGQPVSAGAARRIGCDANIIPIILGGAGEPLDIGRAARTVPPPLRRALIVRDTACAFPGCDRPAAWSEAHHITHWADGGETKLSNLVLLCGPHHIAVHHQGWTVSIDADGLPTFHPPPWIDPTGQPQRHHRYQLRQLTLDNACRAPPAS